jgi:ABC-type branched-subunit amino acid transport system substrate-binding protein
MAVVMVSFAGMLVVTSSSAASAAGNKAPIVIGMITDETGASASGYTDAEYGAVARFDAQNALGGVNGHKIELVVEDDQSSFTGNLTAAQTLVEDKGAFGVIEISTYANGGTPYLAKAKIPVVGDDEDGPEWGQQPNSNMFSVVGTLYTPYNGKTYSYSNDELKELGVTKLAQLVYNIPSAISSANGIFAQAKKQGISKCLDSLIPEGDVSFTTFALQMKKDGCNGLEVLGLLSSCIAVQTALKQANLKVADLCATGYDQSLLTQPAALAAMQGTYATANINVLGNDLTAPVKSYLSRMKKYTNWAGGIPTDNMDFAYESADLIIQGLEHAGANPTRSAFISYLRTVTNYTAGGLIQAPGTNFTHFGTVASLPKKSCSQLYEVKGKSFVPALGGKPICGTLVATPAP